MHLYLATFSYYFIHLWAICIYINISICIYIDICMYISIYIYIYTYVYIKPVFFANEIYRRIVFQSNYVPCGEVFKVIKQRSIYYTTNILLLETNNAFLFVRVHNSYFSRPTPYRGAVLSLCGEGWSGAVLSLQSNWSRLIGIHIFLCFFFNMSTHHDNA
jgi:hypothetical protein